MKFKRIYEKLNQSYDYSSLQIDFSDPIKELVISTGNKIPCHALYTEGEKYGREDEIHCTILYGIHTSKAKDVRQLMSLISPFTITLRDISFFNSDNHNVMKIDIESPKLMQINKFVRDNLEHTDTFPEYHPHCTIAYVIKGTSVPVDPSMFNGMTVKITNVTFSNKNGSHEKITLRI